MKNFNLIFMKRFFTFLILGFLYIPWLHAQISVTATSGTVGPTLYTNFNNAFTAINNGTHQGAISISITASFTETTATPTINASGSGSASYTSILIKPATGVTPTITSTQDNGTTIKLFGADNVTIDGSNTVNGTSRDLTFINSNTSGSGQSSNIWLASNGTNGATNNTIKNCKILGSSSSGGAPYMGVCVFSGNAQGYWLGTSLTTAANSNNIIKNNLLNSANAAVAFNGGVTETGNQIIGNTIGDVSSVVNRKFTNVGIYMQNQSSFTISNNSIVWLAATNTNVAPGGIVIGTTSTSGAIFKNIISGCRFSSTATLTAGILLNATVTPNIDIHNNIIYDIASAGNSTTAANNTHGIAINGGSGYKVNFNTVNMSTNPTTTANGYQAALYIASGTSNLAIRNNILVQTGSNTTNKFSVYSVSANPAASAIDYNNYLASGTTLAYAGAALNTLAAVETSLQNNLNHSRNVAPVFVSATNMHLVITNPSNNVNLSNTGIGIVAITTDIDDEIRKPNPSIGADEIFTTCTGMPTAGTITATPASIPCNATVTLSLTGSSAGTDLLYQWQYLTATGWQNFGTSATSQITPNITGATQFRCTVTCPASSQSATTNPITITPVQPPINIGNDTTLCPNTSITVNAGSGSSYLWSNGATTQTININTAGTYMVSVTHANGCISKDTIVVTNGIIPSSPLADSLDLCQQHTLVLDAANPGSTYLWSPGGATTQQITVSAGGNYIARIKSIHGCIIYDTSHVTMRPFPVRTLRDTTICSTASLSLDAQNAGYSYSWNTGASTQIITVPDSGWYKVLITSPYGCSIVDSAHVHYLEDARVSGFNFIPLFEQQQGLVSFEPINPEYVQGYTWNFGDGSPEVNTMMPDHIFPQTGDYLVTLMVGNDCSYDTVSIPIHVDLLDPTNVHSITNNGLRIQLYPNPAGESIYLSATDQDIIFERISIYNLTGVCVMNQQLTGAGKQELSVSNLPAGLYMIRVLTNKGQAIRKLEIIR